MTDSPTPVDPRPVDPRQRLRELNAIPDRDRTDAEWDELNELEIQLAPCNRLNGPGAERSHAPHKAKSHQRHNNANNPGNAGGNAGGNPGNGEPRKNPQGKRPFGKHFSKKPKPPQQPV